MCIIALPIGGSINLKWAMRISPFIVAQTGAPFDITAAATCSAPRCSMDGRASPTDSSKPGLIQTAYGLLDPNPTAGEPLLPRNYGRGPGTIQCESCGSPRRSASVRSAAAPAIRAPRLTGQSATLAAASGRGLGGLIGSPSTSHRFNLSIGLSVRNLLNHTNPGPIIGNITSPYFGFANQIAGAQNGEGFYETANNRRLESQLKFTF